MTTDIISRPSPALATREPAWLDRDLYPFRSNFHPTEAGRLHYVDEGSGSPVLLVHGTPSWSFEWRHAIRGLREGHRVVAPDHLGFGLSDKPRGAPYRPVDHARRLLDLVRALDLRELCLVVHDFGGPIGLPILLEEPERVRSLVIMNTWMWPVGRDPKVARISRFVRSPLGRFLYQWLNASPRWLLPATFADRSWLTPAIHRHYLGPFTHRVDREAPWVLGCELAGSDDHYTTLWERRDALRDIETCIVWGENDPALGTELTRFAELLPSARIRALPVGHFPQEEAADEVLQTIRDALGQSTPQAGGPAKA